ncbi:hypothetical protein ABGN05_16145 [Aquibium sp. LZ166]|uniref:Addiction module component n=1 Tax=Aquibium pacificus TaxID=3153579 RepID=A0ABV3SLS5_9HYPH
MTKLLEKAVAAARDLPDDVQDEIARIMLNLAGEDGPVIELSSTQEGSFAESLAQARRGEFASEEDVSSVWARHGL